MPVQKLEATYLVRKHYDESQPKQNRAHFANKHNMQIIAGYSICDANNDLRTEQSLNHRHGLVKPTTVNSIRHLVLLVHNIVALNQR